MSQEPLYPESYESLKLFNIPSIGCSFAQMIFQRLLNSSLVYVEFLIKRIKGKHN